MPPSGCLYLVCSARLPPLAPPAVKGCLHGCEVSISTVPSPDATCFYYNRLVPLVLIKYSECSRQSIHPRRQLSVLLFSPSLPLHVASSLPSSNLSQLVSRARMRACARVQSEQMHFSGSAAFTISVTPGNYHTQTAAHNISINVASAPPERTRTVKVAS